MTISSSRTVQVCDNLSVGHSEQLLLIAGPCQIESSQHCLEVAAQLKEITANYPVNLVFKSSFDKANRTSGHSMRGPGIEKGLKILAEVKAQSGLPLLSDIHLPEQAATAAEVVDILQIPAFLCRQTDLLIAAGNTGKAINIKKGQFLAAEDMAHSAEKVASGGSRKILLCERGTCFGYRDLIVDMRNLILLKDTGHPVIFDATHSVQIMGGKKAASGGKREYVLPLCRAAAAVGIDGLFIECHEKPERAPSDGASMLPLSEMSQLLDEVCSIRAALGKKE